MADNNTGGRVRPVLVPQGLASFIVQNLPGGGSYQAAQYPASNPGLPLRNVFNQPSSNPRGPDARDFVSLPPSPGACGPNLSNQGGPSFRASDGRPFIQAGNAGASFARGALNGAMFGMGDTGIAEVNSLFPGLWGTASRAPTYGERLRENRDIQRTQSIADQETHPWASGVGNFIGGLFEPEVKVPGLAAKATGNAAIDAANQFWRDLGQDAMRGGLDGLGESISQEQTPEDASTSIVNDALKEFGIGLAKKKLRSMLPR